MIHLNHKHFLSFLPFPLHYIQWNRILFLIRRLILDVIEKMSDGERNRERERERENQRERERENQRERERGENRKE